LGHNRRDAGMGLLDAELNGFVDFGLLGTLDRERLAVKLRYAQSCTSPFGYECFAFHFDPCG
jgi:hypothetical protein